MKVIKNMLFIICLLFLAWVAISWIDIVADNGFQKPIHYTWNFFKVIFS